MQARTEPQRLQMHVLRIDLRAAGFQIAVTVGDDPEHGDFTLQPESLALKLGFEPIPFREIGPYQGDARAIWPIQEAEGVRENPQWFESVPIDKS